MFDSIRRWHVVAGLVILCFCIAMLAWPFVMQRPAADPPPVTEATEPAARDPVPTEASILASPKASFAVKFKEEVNPYRVMGVFVMPGEDLVLESLFTREGGTYEVQAEAGELEPLPDGSWRWKAPGTGGLYPITVTDLTSGESITLNAFVKIPFDHQSETLNGYRIGQYEARPYRDNPLYNRPDGFVEVTPENEDVRISPHFTLSQFVAKQESGYPKYLILQERLLLKLEMILEEVNKRGIDAPTFHVMSGYRTPFYNRSIGNETSYSAHVYGMAADIFVDANEDGYMDDLDGDGQVTVEEATLLADVIDDLVDETWYQPFIGGLGIYRPAPHRGPFIHVDIRGEPARW